VFRRIRALAYSNYDYMMVHDYHNLSATLHRLFSDFARISFPLILLKNSFYTLSNTRS